VPKEPPTWQLSINTPVIVSIVHTFISHVITMRLSDRFNLPVGQYGIDFVDVNPERDTKLYLNPHFLSTRQDNWSKSAYTTVKSFFQTTIDHIRTGDMKAAEEIFGYLGEPS